MGYLDRISSTNIKWDADGQAVYFHWGTIGEARVVPTAKEEAWLRGQLKMRSILAILGGAAIVVAVLVPIWDPEVRYFLILGIAFFIGGVPGIIISSAISSRTASWPLSSERLTWDEQAHATVEAMGPHGVAIGWALAVLGALVGGMLIVSGRNPFVGTAFIAVALWALYRLWRLRNVARRTT